MPPAEEQPGFYACRSDEVQPGERVIRELNGRSVGRLQRRGPLLRTTQPLPPLRRRAVPWTGDRDDAVGA